MQESIGTQSIHRTSVYTEPDNTPPQRRILAARPRNARARVINAPPNRIVKDTLFVAYRIQFGKENSKGFLTQNMTNHSLASTGPAPYGVFSARRGSLQAYRSRTTAGRRWDGGGGLPAGQAPDR